MQSFSFYLPLWVRPVEVEADADTAPPEVADADVGDENVFVAIDADAAEDACFEPQASILSCLVSFIKFCVMVC